MIGPILNIPIAMHLSEVQTARLLLNLSRQLEGLVGDQATTVQGAMHMYVSMHGAPAVACLDASRFSESYRERLSQIASLSQRQVAGDPTFLTDMAERIRFCAERVGLLSKKALWAYHLLPANDGGAIRYAPLGYVDSDLETGLAYFFGLHVRPIFPKREPVHLFQTTPAQIGFGVTGALSLFSGELELTDLVEATGYIDLRRAAGSKLETTNGWRILR